MSAGRVRGVTGNAGIEIAHGWEVAATPAGQITGPRGLDRLRWVPAHVPGTAASALRAAGEWRWPAANGEQRNFDGEDFWWRAPLGSELGAGCVLGFDGIATLWDAWVDGVHVASGESMWDRRECVLEHTPSELVIRCLSLDRELATKRPRPRWKVPMLEQQQLRWIRTTLLGRTPGWSPPCAAVGPWRAVWLEQRAHPIGDVRISARIAGGVGVVAVVTALVAESATLVVARGDARVTVAMELREGRWQGAARVEQPVLWWPHTHGTPALYEISIEANNFRVDLGRTGFRTLEVGDDFSIRVNGVAVFARGACWTPLDVVTLQASPEAIGEAVQRMCDAGMNMVRIAGTMTYESDALYDALDERGILLWADLMFANLDYPEDAAFSATVEREVKAELGRLQARPSLAIVCGNSEGEQQAAMWGAPRERWAPPLFHQVIPAAVRAVVPEVAYVASSAHGGAFPCASNAGPSSYYGVGAYLRPLEDARRAEVVFASECLAFANIPAPSGMPAGARVHSAAWKARSPRDLGAGWDFDDVRDHYVQRVFGVDPTALRATDHDRYLELGRHATGEVMARTFGEWRRARSVTHGALIWFLQDLWPGAGWGVVDANGRPKACWYALRRSLAPIALAITDEGTNGLALHIANDTAQPITRTLSIELWRGGATNVGRATREVTVRAHSALELAAGDLFESFYDLSYAYRFGPPAAQVIHAQFGEVDQFWFPAGMAAKEPDVGLAANQVGDVLEVSAGRFAQFVSIELPGWLPGDDGFHLAPGQVRTISLRRTAGPIKPGTVSALNAEAGATIVVLAERSP
ncbi:glycoside hydrolase family 2 protein [soil metagenome]